MNDRTDLTKRAQAFGLEAMARIRVAVGSLANQMPTHVRNAAESFTFHLALSKARTTGSEFPITIRRHATNGDFSQANTRWNLVLFYIGNAILTVYELEIARLDSKLTPLLLDLTEHRVLLLETLALTKIEQARVVGSDATGRKLLHPQVEPIFAMIYDLKNPVEATNELSDQTAADPLASSVDSPAADLGNAA